MWTKHAMPKYAMCQNNQSLPFISPTVHIIGKSIWRNRKEARLFMKLPRSCKTAFLDMSRSSFKSLRKLISYLLWNQFLTELFWEFSSYLDWFGTILIISGIFFVQVGEFVVQYLNIFCSASKLDETTCNDVLREVNISAKRRRRCSQTTI